MSETKNNTFKETFITVRKMFVKIILRLTYNFWKRTLTTILEEAVADELITKEQAYELNKRFVLQKK